MHRRPAGAPLDAKLPVMCFIHGIVTILEDLSFILLIESLAHTFHSKSIVHCAGGGFQFGEPEPYNGSALAAQHGVIFASIAYRTGLVALLIGKQHVRAKNKSHAMARRQVPSGSWLSSRMPRTVEPPATG